MESLKSAATLVLFVFLASVVGGTSWGNEAAGVLTENDAFKAIESSILVAAALDAQKAPPHLDAAAMIVALGYVNRLSARKTLVRLSQVYLGEATAEAVHSALTMQGKTIRSELERAKAGRVLCEALKQPSAAVMEYTKTLRCVNQEEYAAFLGAVLDDIDAGRVAPYAL
jgi:hypothetical protein